ncbi:hypothetical protein GKZ68_01225 [Hymenobacter sp. BRD128]|uniref:hypothetical protein n=1 Tax=Hymenobacter sp. BRD128 TaxID=2675878 RepID=UPI001564AF6B|nr:hypothetical protein [Hymenobacter sp. BRD128]QKG55376.1 hypothetical protein GKZ68_01225 [Hymenobacter sp. BRD128]
MKKVLFLAVAAASFSLASCDSKKEEAADKQADAVEASKDATAAKMEASADSTKKAGEHAADAIKSNADTTKKKM